MYSDMSIRIMSFSSSNKNSASARANSVFPTPVGPRKRNDPIGLLVSDNPARLRRTAFATRSSASSCPTTRCLNRSSMCTSFCASPSSKRPTGMPVHLLLQHRRAFLDSRETLFRLLQVALRRGDAAVANLCDLGKFAGAFVSLFFGAQLLDLLFQLPNFTNSLLLGLPTRFARARVFAEFGQLFFDLLAAFLRVRVLVFQ